MTNSALFLAVFLACAVEAVEALTIILAAGTARDWRSANTGLLAGLATLAASSPPSHRRCPRFRWTACGCSSAECCWSSGCNGYARRSCAPAVIRRCTTRRWCSRPRWPLRGRPAPSAAAWWSTGTPSRCRTRASCSRAWKSAFIALTFGANQHNIPLAAAAAVAAVLVVAFVGFRGAGAAVPRSGEQHEVHRRGHADRVRDVLGCRGSGCALAAAMTRRCWS